MTNEQCNHLYQKHLRELFGRCLTCEIERLTRDIESGFMQGAYARLKNLQEAERERDELHARLAAEPPALQCICQGWRHDGHAPYCALNRTGDV